MECDIIMEPAPIARTVNSFAFSESSPNTGNNGNTIDDAVIIATVEEPCAVLMRQVNKKGNQFYFYQAQEQILKPSTKWELPLAEKQGSVLVLQRYLSQFR